MTATDHHVIFRFVLSPALAEHAPLGAWVGAPRGVTLDVGEDGGVRVTGVDHLMSYATKQVLQTAALFLRAIGANAPLSRLRAELSTPETRMRDARPLVYSIAMGAKVSITRMLIEEEPTFVADEPPLLRLASAR